MAIEDRAKRNHRPEFVHTHSAAYIVLLLGLGCITYDSFQVRYVFCRFVASYVIAPEAVFLLASLVGDICIISFIPFMRMFEGCGGYKNNPRLLVAANLSVIVVCNDIFR